MPFSLADIGFGFLLPLVVAGVVAYSISRIAGGKVAGLATSVGFVAAFHSGYWGLKLSPLRPESWWQWLPWLILASVLPSLVPGTHWLSRIARGMLIVSVAAACSWLLMPDWQDLDSTRSQLRGTLMMLTVANVIGFGAIKPSHSVWVPLTTLIAGSLTLSAILLLSGSLLFTQLAGCSVGAFVGLLLAAAAKTEVKVASLSLPVAVCFGGAMLIGKVSSFSDIPDAAYLMCALIPAVTGCCCLLSSRSEKRASRIWISLVPAVLGLASVGLAAYAEFAPE